MKIIIRDTKLEINLNNQNGMDISIDNKRYCVGIEISIEDLEKLNKNISEMLVQLKTNNNKCIGEGYHTDVREVDNCP